MQHQQKLGMITLCTILLVPALIVQAQLPHRYAVEGEALWDLIGPTYKSWKVTDRSPIGLPGPTAQNGHVRYVNRVANRSGDLPLYGSIIVTEHYAGDEQKSLNAVTIAHRVHKDYDSNNQNWYWAHYSADGKLIASSRTSGPFDKGDFLTFEEDGRLWVFHIQDPALADYISKGELAKHVIRPGIGPRGMTLKSSDYDTINEFISLKDGFTTSLEDGRLWVFKTDSDELASFQEHGEPAKCVVRPAAGPGGLTIKSSDADVIEQYINAKSGFEIRMSEGRMWVFTAGDPAIEEYDHQGELAKHVIRPGIGPRGMTLKSNESDTITNYLVQQEGFSVTIEDGRLWVFATGSDAHQSFLEHGEPAKCVVFPAAGPVGMTVKGADREVINAYLRGT